MRVKSCVLNSAGMTDLSDEHGRFMRRDNQRAVELTPLLQA